MSYCTQSSKKRLMKNKLLILFLMVFTMGCNDHKLTHQEVITEYYDAFDSGDYNKIRALINDTITISSGDYVTPYTHKGFYEFFKWDSIFKSRYRIMELEEKDDQVLVTVAQDNVRNEFLKNSPLVFKVGVSFTSGKISKLEELEYIDVNWDIWTKERDSLVNWIKDNHPELDGFINDMSMNGSRNYLKAIEIYITGKSNF